MSNIEKIKAEIERRKGYISVTHFAEELLAFIDSLPEEKPSEDLEEAAKEYATTHLRNNEFPTADSVPSSQGQSG